MGCVSSSSAGDVEAYRSRMIDVSMGANKRIDTDKVKLLLLGAGESGKSTVFKQLRLLYGNGYTDLEKNYFSMHIKHNVIETMEQLCQAVVKINPNDSLVQTPEFQLIRNGTFMDSIGGVVVDAPARVKSFRKLPELTFEKAKAIAALWSAPSIQEAWRRRAEFQIVESAERFLNSVMQLQKLGNSHVPSDEDILHTRIRTSGIREEKYVFEDKSFHFFDVGGQMNERRKWINCFQNVHAVIFLVAISEFDQTLWEDPSRNRMTDSINLFGQIVNDPTFKDAAVFLFFNKSDLLREKIKRVNLTKCGWADFDGTSAADFDQVTNYFKKKFLQIVDSRHHAVKNISCYSTQATDGKTMHEVLKACTPAIIHRHLMGIGMS
jgi:GTPase SAR1 family protein